MIKDNCFSWYRHRQNKHVHAKQQLCLYVDIFPNMSQAASGCSALKRLIVTHITIQEN